MANNSFLSKVRKKIDKEYAAELAAEAQAEKAALKEKKKQEAIAEYNEKRTLTVEKFFQVAGLYMPEVYGMSKIR